MKKTIQFFFSIFCLLQIYFHASAQSANQWTWIKGDSTIRQIGRYGNLGTPDSLNKPGSRYHPVGWTDTSGAMWLFGGTGYANSGSGGDLNDLWKYDINSNKWTWVKGDSIVDAVGIYGTQGVPSITNKPKGRRQAVSWLDKQNNLWLFGGSIYNDLWRYNVSSNQWTWLKGGNANSGAFKYGVYGTKGVGADANTPGGRYGSVSWTDKLGNLWLFGGYGATSTESQTNLNDLWKYNVTTNQWTWVSGDNIGTVSGNYGQIGISSLLNKPGARWESSGWTDSSGNFWLFGGFGVAADSLSYGCLNDLWMFNPSTNEWTWVKGDSTTYNLSSYGTKGIENSGNQPGGRIDGGVWADKIGNLWLYGGGGCNVSYLSDLWKYNIASNSWTWIDGDSTGEIMGEYGQLGTASATNHPGSKDAAVSWLDKNGNLLLFGGYGYARDSVAGYLNDIWKYTLNNVFPVTLVSFTGTLRDDNCHFSWSEKNEVNVKLYELERSINGRNFTKVGETKATNAGQYTSVDNISSVTEKQIYYRLKIVNSDGSYSYSFVVPVLVSFKVRFTVWPNPAKDYCKVIFNTGAAGATTISLIDINGKIIKKISVPTDGLSVTMPIGNLSSGIYTVMLVCNNKEYIQKVVITK